MNMIKLRKALHLKIMLQLYHTFQKLTDNAEDIDIVMSMYNLLEYNRNYYMTSGSL